MKGIARDPIRVEVHRGPVLESWHHVHGVVVPVDSPDDGRAGTAWGDPALVTTLRSAWKAVQAVPVVADGAAEAFGWGDEELALAAGSHSGEADHVAVATRMLSSAGLEASVLRCGAHRPYHGPSADEVASGFGPLHNNCSGKHAAMLAWCVHMDVDPEGYRNEAHAVQRRIFDALAACMPPPGDGWPVAVDGCGVPTPALALHEIAEVMRAVARAGEDGGGDLAALARVRDAVRRQPHMVAGTERVDSEALTATGGALWCKAGAEGLWAGVDLDAGLAFAFKALDGEFRAVVPAALSALATLGSTHAEADALAKWRRPVLRNRPGDDVGALVARVPGPSS